MDFMDRLRELAAQIPKQVEYIRTEEATKSALVMPFIGALGYNVFDPSEVTPEFVADVGIKKGEKVDYVILKEGKPIIMFECKSVNTDLDKITPTQLYRYFSVCAARFGILTNGVVYRVFSDLEEQNKMDTKPFLELNMLALEEPVVEEVKKFTKALFDVNNILLSANEFKYTREIKRILAAQLLQPSDDFIKFLANPIYTGRMVQSVREQFGQIVKKAFNQFINEQINARLRSALVPDTTLPESVPATSATDVSATATPSDGTVADVTKTDKQVTTTAEELEAYYIIKAILRETTPAKRIVMRDAQTYCAILLDDNNRKPICRLYFNGAQKYVAYLNEERKEEKVSVNNVDDLYHQAERLKAAVAGYDNHPA
jgi:predicted type IV restriction endonuclease